MCTCASMCEGVRVLMCDPVRVPTCVNAHIYAYLPPCVLLQLTVLAGVCVLLHKRVETRRLELLPVNEG